MRRRVRVNAIMSVTLDKDMKLEGDERIKVAHEGHIIGVHVTSERRRTHPARVSSRACAWKRKIQAFSANGRSRYVKDDQPYYMNVVVARRMPVRNDLPKCLAVPQFATWLALKTTQLYTFTGETAPVPQNLVQ